MSDLVDKSYQVWDEGGRKRSIVRSKLSKASKKIQKQTMLNWFHSNYTSPENLPYESAEDGYQFIHGGPYEPEDVLSQEFSGVVDDELLEAVASDLSDEWSEWSGIERPEDYYDYYENELAASLGFAEEFERSIQGVEALLSLEIKGDSQQALVRMLFANVVTAMETFLCDVFVDAVKQHELIKRRFVESNPDFKKEKLAYSELFLAWSAVDARISEYLLGIVWHDLSRVTQMYKAAIGVDFPSDVGPLFKAILVRHDLVHRNGRKKAGGEHLLLKADVLKVAADARRLVRDLDAKCRSAKAALKPVSLDPPPELAC